MIKKTKFERACSLNRALIATNKDIAAKITRKVDHLCYSKSKASAAAAAASCHDQREEQNQRPNPQEEEKLHQYPHNNQQEEEKKRLHERYKRECLECDDELDENIKYHMKEATKYLE